MTTKSQPFGGKPPGPGEPPPAGKPQRLRSPVNAGNVETLLDNFIQQLNKANSGEDVRSLQQRISTLAADPLQAAKPKASEPVKPQAGDEDAAARHAVRQRFTEFASYLRQQEAAPPAAAHKPATHTGEDGRRGAANPPDLEWFEKRFDDLGRMLEKPSSSTVAEERDSLIQKRLDEILLRLDTLQRAPSPGATLKAVDERLQELSQHLRDNATRSEVQLESLGKIGDRLETMAKISEQTALAVVHSARHAEAAVEAAAEKSAHRGSELTARHLTEALRQFWPAARFTAIETEVRALNQQSRETGLRAAKALEEVHDTLRQFLEKVTVHAKAPEFAFAGTAQPYTAAPPPQRAEISRPVRPYQGPGIPYPWEVNRHAQRDDDARPLASRPPANRPAASRTPPDAAATLHKTAAVSESNAYARPHADSADVDYEMQNGRRLKRGLFVAAFIMLLACLGMLYLTFMDNRPPAPIAGTPKASLEAKPVQAAKAAKLIADGDDDLSWTAVSVPGISVANPAGGPQERTAAIGASGDMLARTRMLAENNHAVSQYRLATFYQRGEGVAKDLRIAEVWYRRAAEQGNVLAMHNLASLYAGSDGGQAARETAIKWFRQAAEHGLTDSQYNLGVLLETAKDSEWPEAYKWYARAALSGDLEAEWKRVKLRDRMTLAQIKAAEKLLAGWKPRPWDEKANTSPKTA